MSTIGDTLGFYVLFHDRMIRANLDFHVEFPNSNLMGQIIAIDEVYCRSYFGRSVVGYFEAIEKNALT